MHRINGTYVVIFRSQYNGWGRVLEPRLDKIYLIFCSSELAKHGRWRCKNVFVLKRDNLNSWSLYLNERTKWIRQLLLVFQTCAMQTNWSLLHTFLSLQGCHPASPTSKMHLNLKPDCARPFNKVSSRVYALSYFDHNNHS